MTRPNQSPEATIASLRNQIETQREEIRQLRELLNPPVSLPTRWSLTRQQARLVIGLARGQGQPLTTEHLLGVMYGPGHEHGHSCLHVAVLKIRRKKDLHGLTTANHYGGLFSMAPESCAAVLAALKGTTSPKKLGGEMRGEAPIGAMAVPEQAAA